MSVKDNSSLGIACRDYFNPVKKVIVFGIAHADISAFTVTVSTLLKIEYIITALNIRKSVCENIDRNVTVAVNKHNPVRCGSGSGKYMSHELKTVAGGNCYVLANCVFVPFLHALHCRKIILLYDIFRSSGGESI